VASRIGKAFNGGYPSYNLHQETEKLSRNTSFASPELYVTDGVFFAHRE